MRNKYEIEYNQFNIFLRQALDRVISLSEKEDWEEWSLDELYPAFEDVHRWGNKIVTSKAIMEALKEK